MAAFAGLLQPSVTTVQFGEITFNAFSSNFSMFTPIPADGFMPLMGQTQFSIQVFIDMHDNVNFPFDKVSYLFGNAHTLTRDKVKDFKLTFWVDERRQDALSTFSFKAWIVDFRVLSGGGQNHLVMLRIQPMPGQSQYVDIKHGN